MGKTEDKKLNIKTDPRRKKFLDNVKKHFNLEQQSDDNGKDTDDLKRDDNEQNEPVIKSAVKSNDKQNDNSIRKRKEDLLTGNNENEVSNTNGDSEEEMKHNDKESDDIVNQPVPNTMNGNDVKESRKKEIMINPENGRATDSKNGRPKSQRKSNGVPKSQRNSKNGPQQKSQNQLNSTK